MTHPIWLLAVFGQARYIIPLIVFVIGAHFLPIAKIMDRKTAYLLGVGGAVVHGGKLPLDLDTVSGGVITP